MVPPFPVSRLPLAHAACTAFLVLFSGDLAQAPLIPAGPFPESASAAVPQRYLPRRLRIGAIGIDAPIRDVGLLPNEQLDVPPEPDVVGWYRLGPLPGESGNAVLDGHLDLPGTKGVFWRLNELQPGDELEVDDEAGERRRFRVTETKVYDVHAAPLDVIFGDVDGKRLNLITCAGTWSDELDHYDKRLVVFTELIEDESQ